MSNPNSVGGALKAVDPVNPDSLPGQLIQLRSNASDLEREITMLRERLSPVLRGSDNAVAKPDEPRVQSSPLNEDVQDLNARFAKASKAIEDLRHELDL